MKVSLAEFDWKAKADWGGTIMKVAGGGSGDLLDLLAGLVHSFDLVLHSQIDRVLDRRLNSRRSDH